MVATRSVKSTYIIIDMEKCKGCRYCVSVCPQNIISMDTNLNKNGYTPAFVIEEKASRCTGCLTCTVMCPESAISAFLHVKSA